MSISKLILSIVFVCFLVGCNEENKSNTSEGDDYLESEYILLDLDEEDSVTRYEEYQPDSFVTKCPGGVCDRNSTYLAHSYDDENVYLYLSFSPELVDNYSLQSLIETFNYVNLVLKFPERSSNNTKVYFSSLETLRELGDEIILSSTNGIKLGFIEFTEGKLRGEVKGIITELIHETKDSEDPNCISDDIVGLCSDRENVYIPFMLKFNLLIEQQKG